MVADLKRLNVGQGFLAHYPYKRGLKSVAVLIADDKTPDGARQSAIEQIQNHFLEINGLHIFERDKLERPIFYGLSEDTNYTMAAEMAMRSDMSKQILVCHGWDVYVDVCTIMGITRSDHLRLATEDGWANPSIKTQAKGKPRTYFPDFLKAVQKSRISTKDFSDKALGDNYTIRQAELADMYKFINAALSQGVRHIHLGETAYKDAFGAQIAHMEPARMSLPQPYCLFEMTLKMQGQDEMANASKPLPVFILAIQGRDGVVSTLRFARLNLATYQVDFYGLQWGPDTQPGTVEMYEWFQKLDVSAEDDEENERHKAMMDQSILFPALTALQDMATRLTRYHHDRQLHKSMRQTPVRDFFTIDPKIIDMSRKGQQPIERLAERRKAHTRAAGTALHQVDQFWRRRPNSAPDSEKTVKVKAHERGDPRFGTKGRVVTFRQPDLKKS